MSVLGVTLARGGSKGVPGKHLRLLGGKPMLAWTLEAAKAATRLDRYILSSDDDGILDLADAHEVFTIKRPGDLAKDDTPTLPALIHAVRTYERETGWHFDYIVEIRATTPFKTAHDIDAMTNMLVDTGADAVIGVTPLIDHHPARAKWMDEHGYIREFVHEPPTGRRQDLKPPAFVRNGTVYALRREWVMGPTPKLFGQPKALGYEMPEERSVNIDTEYDFGYAEYMVYRKVMA